MSALLQPGSDGDAAVSFESSGFRDWRRGAVYTIRRVDTPPEDRPYRVLVAYRARDLSYADLYARAAALRGPGPIVVRAWGRHEGAFPFVFATISTETGSVGLPEPTAEELAAPHGTVPTHAMSPTHYYDEIYNAFDFGVGAMMFSYGEYVASTQRLDFAPYIERAERAARRHHERLEACTAFQILRREWLFAGDANSMQVVVHVYGAPGK